MGSKEEASRVPLFHFSPPCLPAIFTTFPPNGEPVQLQVVVLKLVLHECAAAARFWTRLTVSSMPHYLIGCLNHRCTLLVSFFLCVGQMCFSYGIIGYLCATEIVKFMRLPINNNCLLKETRCGNKLVHIRLNYGATYSRTIVSTKIDNKSQSYFKNSLTTFNFFLKVK